MKTIRATGRGGMNIMRARHNSHGIPKKRYPDAGQSVASGNSKRLQIFLAAWAGLASVVIMAWGSVAAAQRPGGEGSASVSSGATVVYPSALFDNGKARFYSYKTEDGITVKYFIVKSSDGVIRAAFDACDVCWRAGKGYSQEGDTMVCRNCGRKFATNKVNEVKGGCNPAPLKRTVENGKVILQVADLLEGRQYFDFSGRGGKR